MTKKERDRYRELLDEALDRFFDNTEFYAQDWLNKDEAKEFLQLNEKLFAEQKS